MPALPEDEDADPVGANKQRTSEKRAVREGDTPVGESSNDGSSPEEEPHHIAKQQRDR